MVQIISSAIAFNKKLIWENNSKNLYLATTTRELIEIFRLRSEVYTKIKYDNEFPDMIKGLNFDTYDENSAILYTKVNDIVTGTCRVIFDSDKKLPIDTHFPLDYLRAEGKSIVEISRLSVKHDRVGLNQEFKWLTKGVYLITLKNSITKTISAIKDEHFKLYSKFGGFTFAKKINIYGKLPNPLIITFWDTLKISNFFKKAFLGELKTA
ncbi:hypothetical protein KKC13_08160 [bacterium]|nr:hypothetical protein [bacterium]MBU1958567.1 hypothetical protein [bacterium]